MLPLTGVVDPNQPVEGQGGGRAPTVLGKPHAAGPGEPGGVMYSSDDIIPIYVATPELLAYYGIDPASVAAGTDVLTPRSGFAGYDLIPGRHTNWQPVLQQVALPAYRSLPNVLITEHGLAQLHLDKIPVGWLIDAPGPVTAAQVDQADRSAAAAGLSVESRPTGADATRLAAYATATGIAVALGVLAMTVGLIRSETARDLRTLAAAGARRSTRRALTAATAGALALSGAIIGTACAYLALLAWYHRELHWLGHPPVLELAAILAGLPVVAYLAGWLLTGREVTAMARQPLD
jgi:putative ABC transport system permease protein